MHALYKYIKKIAGSKMKNFKYYFLVLFAISFASLAHAGDCCKSVRERGVVESIRRQTPGGAVRGAFSDMGKAIREGHDKVMEAAMKRDWWSKISWSGSQWQQETEWSAVIICYYFYLKIVFLCDCELLIIIDKYHIFRDRETK